MRLIQGSSALVLAVTLTLGLVIGGGLALAQEPGPGCCRGQGKGMHGGMDAGHRQDMELFHFLLDHGDSITRTVTEVGNGVETLTESEDPEVASRIREHVRSMYARVKDGRPIHARDPLFAEIFRHAEQIEMEMTETPKGIRVKETSKDPYVVELIQAHAEVVNQFIANGRAEMHVDHPVPKR